MKNNYLILILTFVFYNCGGNIEPNETSDNSKSPSTATEPNEEVESEKEMESAEFVYDLKGYSNLDFTAYVDDPDSKGPTNIRSKPNGSVLVPLEKNDEYMVHIVESNEGWFKIDGVIAFDNVIDIPGQFGWIHHSVLSVSTRNYGGQSISLYENPTSSSKEIATVKNEVSLRFSKLYENFAFVNFVDESGKKVEGWMDVEWLCGNPVTNCN